jgi:hypothetical protein
VNGVALGQTFNVYVWSTVPILSRMIRESLSKSMATGAISLRPCTIRSDRSALTEPAWLALISLRLLIATFRVTCGRRLSSGARGKEHSCLSDQAGQRFSGGRAGVALEQTEREMADGEC